MAGPEGIEPSFLLLERSVLPLYDGPMRLAKLWYIASSVLATFEFLVLSFRCLKVYLNSLNFCYDYQRFSWEIKREGF